MPKRGKYEQLPSIKNIRVREPNHTRVKYFSPRRAALPRESLVYSLRFEENAGEGETFYNTGGWKKFSKQRQKQLITNRIEEIRRENGSGINSDTIRRTDAPEQQQGEQQ